MTKPCAVTPPADSSTPSGLLPDRVVKSKSRTNAAARGGCSTEAKANPAARTQGLGMVAKLALTDHSPNSCCESAAAAILVAASCRCCACPLPGSSGNDYLDVMTAATNVRDCKALQ